MGWFPVVAEDIAEVEIQLGIALPPIYQRVLLEQRAIGPLSRRDVGALDGAVSMQRFAQWTTILRDAHPEFPRDGVVAIGPSSNGEFRLDWGNWRFWLPDKKNPGQLGDVFHNWNLKTRKKSVDCSTVDMLAIYFEVAHGKDSSLLRELGYVPTPPPPAPPLVTSLPCDPALLACLDLRGSDLVAVLPTIANTWLPCAQLTLTGNFLCPRDLGQEPTRDAHASVRVGPGVFDVTVRLCKSGIADSDRLVVQAARVLKQGALADASGVGFDVDVDLGAICLFDRQAFFKQVPVHDRDEALERTSDLGQKPGVIIAGKNAQALVVPSGDGDGVYQVVPLLEAGQSVGLEICFINPTV
jgi:hypothetical protein